MSAEIGANRRHNYGRVIAEVQKALKEAKAFGESDGKLACRRCHYNLAALYRTAMRGR